MTAAEQDAFDPPPDPRQDHDHGLVPLTAVDDPPLHRPMVGAEVKVTPEVAVFAGPHAPFTIAMIVTDFRVQPEIAPLLSSVRALNVYVPGVGHE